MTTQRRAKNEGTIFFDKKRNRYTAQLTIGFHPETGRPVRKTRHAATKREAAAALKKLKEQYSAVSFADADRLTFGQWLERWFEAYARPKIRENTAVSYKRYLRPAREQLGSVVISQLTPSDLQTVLNASYGNSYVQARIFRILLRAALGRAVVDGLLHKNPAENLELPVKKDVKPFAKPTMEAWRLLMDAETPHYWWRMLMQMEFVTGMRRAELLGLRWQDIDIEKDGKGQPVQGVIHVRHALAHGERGRLLLGDTKTKDGKRELRVPPEFCRELISYHRQQAAVRLRSAEWQEQDFVFTQDDGNPVPPNRMSAYYRRLRARLGIRTTFHMLRHDLACRMKQSRRFDFKDIQEQLGHSNISITLDYYTHIGEEDREAVSCWLGEGYGELIAPAGSKKKKGAS